MVCSDNYDDFQKKIPRKSKFLSRQLKREEEAKREEKERNRAREESGVRERESRSKMEGAGKGGKEGVDVRCLSLEELEAMNRDLEERAASSVAARLWREGCHCFTRPVQAPVIQAQQAD